MGRPQAQGMLHRLNWLYTWGCSGTWSGAFQCWGMQHKESPLCVCCNGQRVATNVEYKSLDATANPYIALAAIITAGLLVDTPLLFYFISNVTALAEPSCNASPLWALGAIIRSGLVLGE